MSGKSRGYEEILADLKEKGSLPALEGDMHEDNMHRRLLLGWEHGLDTRFVFL